MIEKELSAEIVLRNGRIYTAKSASPWAEVLAIRGGKLVLVGTDSDVKSLITSDTQVIDLKGKMVMPGINDVHTHPMLGGRADLYECHFLPTLSFDEMLSVIRSE